MRRGYYYYYYASKSEHIDTPYQKQNKNPHFDMASVTASTRKKTVLTIKEKYTALIDLEKGLSKKAISEKFNVPKNTLTYWIRNKHDIIQKYETGQLGAKRQKLSVGKHDSIDKAVYKWFMNARERNVPIGGYIIGRRLWILQKNSTL